LTARVANAALGVAAYLGRTVWPAGLGAYYPLPAVPPPAWSVLAAAALVLALTAAALIGAGRRPALAAGWAWFLVALAPMSGLIQVGDQATADRFTYLPSMGLAIAIGWEASALAARRPGTGRALRLAAAAALLALGAATWSQVGTWRDNGTLYRQALAVTRDNWLVLGNHGRVQLLRGDLPEAIASFRRAVELRPAFLQGRMNLARSLELAEERGLDVPGIPDPLREAEEQYRRALELEHAPPEAWVFLSGLLARTGRRGEARHVLGDFLATNPEGKPAAVAAMNLGILLALESRFPEAIARLEEAVRRDPGSAEACYNLGLALRGAGREAEARDRFVQALRLDPRYAKARRALEGAAAP
jgi:Flp pilus assembly protein TadD